jgi:archaellum component FlaC
VPITFILAIVLQTFGVIWYMSTLDANVTLNARDIARHEIRINEMEKQTQELKVLNARIDENIKAIREMMEQSRTN